MTEPIVSSASTASFVMVDVQCANCGDPVGCEVDAPAPAGLVTICAGCRTELLAAPALPAGYELVREIGRGGMGAVFLARHRILGLERAVKMVLPEGAVSEAARAQFLEEARLHARLAHARIVQVHDLSEVRPGVFAIVMEYVPGPNACELLRARPGGVLEPREAVAIATQALEALAYVHAQGVLHCDVKDPNLLVVEQPALSVKLSDFGLARSYALSGASSRKRTNVTSGTVPYMPPEQARGLPLTPQSDLYALGATLYRLLSGCYPHDFAPGGDRLEVVRHHRPQPLRARRPELGEALAAAVDRSLARAAADRFGSAEEMRQALLAA